ncbi:hypothetical protein [Aminobacter sp. HY435]|uniref:hypothetical protein n=1 Tax=Aminobacter sp. HY435 TaxID=2970917 RepID=UPI0022B96F15|nr:hypothetical protein [Aminobacter sp. HY435]
MYEFAVSAGEGTLIEHGLTPDIGTLTDIWSSPEFTIIFRLVEDASECETGK